MKYSIYNKIFQGYLKIILKFTYNICYYMIIKEKGEIYHG